MAKSKTMIRYTYVFSKHYLIALKSFFGTLS